MSRKYNWACSACGELSGRQFSIKRHIDNKNIHGGNARIIPIAEYLAGVNAGLYNPAIDRLVNKLNTAHKPQFAGQRTPHNAGVAASSNADNSHAGEGTMIYSRKFVETIAEHDANEMITSWKGKSEDLVSAGKALCLRVYEGALAGKEDLASEIEKTLNLSMHAKEVELQGLLVQASFAAKNSRSSKVPLQFGVENKQEDADKAEIEMEIRKNIMNMKMEDELKRRMANYKKQQESCKVDVGRIKELLGKRPDETVTPLELRTGCAKSLEISKIVSKHWGSKDFPEYFALA